MQKKNREETVVHTFQPVYDENSRVLMLGTMPSPKIQGAGLLLRSSAQSFLAGPGGYFRGAGAWDD